MNDEKTRGDNNNNNKNKQKQQQQQQTFIFSTCDFTVSNLIWLVVKAVDGVRAEEVEEAVMGEEAAEEAEEEEEEEEEVAELVVEVEAVLVAAVVAVTREAEGNNEDAEFSSYESRSEGI